MGIEPSIRRFEERRLTNGQHGLNLSHHCKYTIYVPKCFRNRVKTVQTMDSNGPWFSIRLSCALTICTNEEWIKND